MLEKILDAIGGRSQTIASQADAIERLEAQIKESNNEKDLAVADLRKVERLAKQSGDKLRERVKEVLASNKRLEGEIKRLEGEVASAEGEWKEMKGQHFEMTETLVAMEHRQAERQIELNDMTALKEGLEKALAEAEANLTVAMKENESLKTELASAIAEREEQSAMLDEAVEALQNIGETLGIDLKEKSDD